MSGSGLRPNALAAIVMLLAQLALGMGVALYSALPAADLGKGTLGGFGAAVAHGPALLTLHALLGTLLLVGGITAVARSVRLGQAPQIGLSSVALASLLVAWLSGSRWVGMPSDGVSLAMALATALALLCYALILFITPAHPRRRAEPCS